MTLEVLEQEEEASEPDLPQGNRPSPRPFIPGTTGEKEWGPIAK